MKKILAIAALVALTGCASPDYAKYSEAQVKIAEANERAAKYRYDALASMASSGSDVAKVAAVMAMQQPSGNTARTDIAAPVNQTLQWASILAPTLTQLYSVSANKQISMHQMDNNRQIQEQQIDGYVKFGAMINSPTVVTQPAPIIVKPEVVQQQVVQPQIVQVR